MLLLLAHLGHFLRHWRVAVAGVAAIAAGTSHRINHQGPVLAAGIEVWRVAGDRADYPVKLHGDHAISHALDAVARSLQVFAGDLEHAAGTVADDEERDAFVLLRQMSGNV